MKKAQLTRTAWGFVAAAILFLLPVVTFGADDRPDAVGRALQQSALTQEEQAAVRARAAAAVGAGVPAEDVAIIVARSAKRGTDAGTIGRLLDTAKAAKQQGLPVGPVLDRIEQGLSKEVAAERIAAAAKRLADKLAVAQPVVDGLMHSGVKPGRAGEREEAVEATARALEQSLSVEDLKGMGADLRSGKGTLSAFTGAANAAAYFAGNGMSVKTAAHLVRTALEGGAKEGDFDGMIRQFNNDLRQGMKAEDAAQKMEHRMGSEQGLRDEMHQDMKGDHGGRGGGAGGGMGGMGGRGR